MFNQELTVRIYSLVGGKTENCNVMIMIWGVACISIQTIILGMFFQQTDVIKLTS